MGELEPVLYPILFLQKEESGQPRREKCGGSWRPLSPSQGEEATYLSG